MTESFVAGLAIGALIILITFYLMVVYGGLGTRFIKALWNARATNLFVWAVFDTYLRQKGWRTGPRMGKLTRQQRRRIERFRVRLGLL